MSYNYYDLYTTQNIFLIKSGECHTERRLSRHAVRGSKFRNLDTMDCH